MHTQNSDADSPNVPKRHLGFGIAIACLIAIFSLSYYGAGKNYSQQEISKAKFNTLLRDNSVKKLIHFKNQEYVAVYLNEKGIKQHSKKGKTTLTANQPGPHLFFYVSYPEQLDQILEPHNKKYQDYIVDTSYPYSLLGALSSILYFVFLAGMCWFLFRGSQRLGEGFGVIKSKASLFDPEKGAKVTFKDIAGLEEVKEEVQEIVAFLKHPNRITKLGGKIPKGALLIGPPGTGKTLLAKAIAGEAGVPFFYASGSSFSGMFVGLGTERVEELFGRAKRKAPCIVFIDEIDAIGRKRGDSVVVGSSFDTENTLNTLLIQMDGFSPNEGVIVLAATNRFEVLDKALLRPGRFDRKILFNLPTIKEREAIFKVHMKRLKLVKNSQLAHTLATQTPGFAGAEIANVCNESAIIAARRGKAQIGMQDFQEAIDRVIAGLEKKSMVISPEEKEIVAHHEAGHALVSWFLEHAHPLVKVTIVPRGVALGYAQYLPKEQFLYQQEQLTDDMCSLLGGRAAEEIIFGKISTGAQNDLERVTRIAYEMVTVYGMSPKVGNLSFYHPKQEKNTFIKPYSESTGQLIDEEARTIVNEMYARARAVLEAKKPHLERLAAALLEREILYRKDLEEMLGERPFSTKKAPATQSQEAEDLSKPIPTS